MAVDISLSMVMAEREACCCPLRPPPLSFFPGKPSVDAVGKMLQEAERMGINPEASDELMMRSCHARGSAPCMGLMQAWAHACLHACMGPRSEVAQMRLLPDSCAPMCSCTAR